jgi:hypothetical protein
MILRGRSSINGCDLPTEVVDFALDGYGNEVGNAERISQYFLGVKKCLDFWDTRTLDCNASQPWISWGIPEEYVKQQISPSIVSSRSVHVEGRESNDKNIQTISNIRCLQLIFPCIQLENAGSLTHT